MDCNVVCSTKVKCLSRNLRVAVNYDGSHLLNWE